MSSSVASAGEHTAQQNFNPSWMRSTFNGSGGGGVIGSTPRASANEDHQENYSISEPILSKYCYERDDLLALQPSESNPPEGLRDCPFFVEIAQSPLVNNPLSNLEQRFQSNINSSKALSSLSHSDRVAIAAGAVYGDGYSQKQNENSPSIGGGGTRGAVGSGNNASGGSGGGGWTPVKSNKNTPDRSQRGGGTVRGGGFFSRTRGGMTPQASENGHHGGTNGSAPGTPDDGGSPFSSKFALRRGGGAGSIERSSSTNSASFNPRAAALFNSKNSSDRPKIVGSSLTKSESGDEDEDEGGWSTVAAPGSGSRATQNNPQPSRPAWGRSESWNTRNAENPWNREVSATNGSTKPEIYNDRAQMLQSALRHQSSSEEPEKDAAGKTPVTQSSSVSSSNPSNSENIQTAPIADDASAATSNTSQLNTENASSSNHSQFPWPALNPALYSIEHVRNIQQLMAAKYARQVSQQQPQIVPQPAATVENVKQEISYYYLDPTKTKRGPFSKEQMVAWFKAGYFAEESLKVQRGENGEYKTIGELLQLNGKLTPFDYPEDEVIIGQSSQQAPVRLDLMGFPNAIRANSAGFPGLFGNQVWANSPGGMDMNVFWQSSVEQHILAERQRLLDEHNRRLQEEAEKFQQMQAELVRQVAAQQELSAQQLREQENALIRHKEELQRRELEMKEQALEVQRKIEEEKKILEEKKRAIEIENAKKLAEQKLILEEEARKKREAEAAVLEKKEAELRAKRANELAEKERKRLEKEAEIAAEKIRLMKKKAEEEAAAEKKRKEEEARKKVEELSLKETSRAETVQVSANEEEKNEGLVKDAPVKHTKVAPWAAKPIEQKIDSEKTLREIQLEEERKLKMEQEKLMKQRKEEQSQLAAQSVGSWGNSSSRLPWAQSNGKPKSGGAVWATPAAQESSRSNISPLLSGPPLEVANRVQSVVKKVPTASAKATSKPVEKTKQQVALESLTSWFGKRFKSLSSSSEEVDTNMLFSFVMDLENPNEVEDIVMSYLDESKAVKEFVREFLKRRIEMRNSGGRPDVDDLSSARTVSAAPSDNTGSNSGSGSQGKNKKKKNQKMVLDGNILGFRGAAAADRLNKGEIDAIPSAPINPSRR